VGLVDEEAMVCRDFNCYVRCVIERGMTVAYLLLYPYSRPTVDLSSFNRTTRMQEASLLFGARPVCAATARTKETGPGPPNPRLA
jgi:hypothetical protein